MKIIAVSIALFSNGRQIRFLTSLLIFIEYYINGKGCLSDMFRCENGPCINRTLRCNGQPDCPFDNSDELDCHFKNFDNVPNIHIFDRKLSILVWLNFFQKKKKFFDNFKKKFILFEFF